MNYNKLKVVKKCDNPKFAFLLVLFQMIFIYESMTTTNRWSKEFLVFFPLIVILFLFIWRVIIIRRKININVLLFLLITIFGKIFTCLLWGDFAADNIVFIAIISTSYMLYEILEIKTYWKQFCNVILVMCLFSFVATYILAPLNLENGLNLGETFKNQLGTPFFDFGFTYCVAWHGILRNQGYFREPGVFQIFLLLALVLLLFNNDTKTKKQKIFESIKVSIIVVSTITTMSNVGIPCLIFILLIYLVVNKKNKNKYLFVLCFLLIIIILISIITKNKIYDIFIERVFDTLNKNENMGSLGVRIEGPINILKELFSSPIKLLFGDSFVHGLNNVKLLNSVSKTDVTGTHLVIALGLGLPYGLFSMFLLYRFMCYFIDNRFMAITMSIIIFISMLTQNIIYNSFLWCINFYAVGTIKLKNHLRT